MNRWLWLLSLFLFIASCSREWSGPDTPPLFTFGIVSDVQYADTENEGTRFYRLSPGKLARAADVFNERRVSFVISLGDFIDNSFESYDTLNVIIRRLRMPFHHVAGNHDFDENEGNHVRLLSTLNLSKFYYSFTTDSWRFIILNGNDISMNAWEPGSDQYREAERYLLKLEEDGAPNACYWNGAIGETQISWLKNELDTATLRHEKVIIACHFPLLSVNSTELLWNCEEVINIIEEYPVVVAYLNGHGHISQHFRRKGVNHVMFRGMVEGDDNAFAIVSVYDDCLYIKGYGKEKSRWLKD